MQVVPPSEPPKERSFLDGPGAVALLLVGAAAVFTATARRPLTHSELRYVEAGREMLESGDWIVPRLSYVAYFEKPILTYWLEAAAQAAFGLSMIAVRVPFILACVAMTWTTFAFGRSLRGQRFGLGAAALLASSGMFQELGPSPLTDGLFSAFVAFGWYAFWRHDRAPRSGWIWAFWTSLGFAVLTKGPLGVVLAGTAIGVYLLLARRLLDAFKMRFVRGALIVVAINLPWWWVVWTKDPRYVSFFFIRENWEAFFSPHVNHPGPPWYYAQFVLLAVFPFFTLGAWAIGVGVGKGLAPALRPRRADAPPIDEARLYLACMFAAPLLFLTVSASKLGTYLLPLLPGIALLFASYVADRLARPSAMLRRATLAQAAVACAAVAVVAPFFDKLPAKWLDAAHGSGSSIALAAVLLVAPMLVGGWMMARGRVVPGMAVVAAGSFGCVLVVNDMTPELRVEQEAGALVERMKKVRRPEEAVVVFSPLADDYSIVFALRERPLIWGKLSELGMGHFTEATSKDTPFPKSVDVDGEILDVYHLGGRLPLPQNRHMLDTPTFRSRWAGPDRMWLVARAKDVPLLRDSGLVIHVFAARLERAVLTNRPER
jgi:4-amino-4-deoxy-L-arabinose transferase-like glycosyltransferase